MPFITAYSAVFTPRAACSAALLTQLSCVIVIVIQRGEAGGQGEEPLEEAQSNHQVSAAAKAVANGKSQQQAQAAAATPVNYVTIAAQPSARPPPPLCGVCGLKAPYTCLFCATRYCSKKCLSQHSETRYVFVTYGCVLDSYFRALTCLSQSQFFSVLAAHKRSPCPCVRPRGTHPAASN